MEKHTKLAYIKSKDIDKLLGFVWRLPYKIEVKGNPVINKNIWYLYFVYPDSVNLERKRIINIDLDQLS